jgi:hypothetical protein
MSSIDRADLRLRLLLPCRDLGSRLKSSDLFLFSALWELKLASIRSGEWRSGMMVLRLGPFKYCIKSSVSMALVSGLKVTRSLPNRIWCFRLTLYASYSTDLCLCWVFGWAIELLLCYELLSFNSSSSGKYSRL